MPRLSHGGLGIEVPLLLQMWAAFPTRLPLSLCPSRALSTCNGSRVAAADREDSTGGKTALSQLAAQPSGQAGQRLQVETGAWAGRLMAESGENIGGESEGPRALEPGSLKPCGAHQSAQ